MEYIFVSFSLLKFGRWIDSWIVDDLCPHHDEKDEECHRHQDLKEGDDPVPQLQLPILPHHDSELSRQRRRRRHPQLSDGWIYFTIDNFTEESMACSQRWERREESCAPIQRTTFFPSAKMGSRVRSAESSIRRSDDDDHSITCCRFFSNFA